MKRVLLVLGLSGFAALALGRLWQLNTTVVVAAVCLTAGIIGCLPPVARAHGRAYGAGLLAAGFALLLFAGKEVTVYRPAAAWDGQNAYVEATITELRPTSETTAPCILTVTAGDLPAGTRLWMDVSWSADAPTLYGTVRGTAVLRDIVWEENHWFGLGNGKSEGVYLIAQPSGIGFMEVRPRTTAASRTATDFLYAVRSGARECLTAALPSDVQPLLSAVCLGDKESLPPAVTANFRKSGVAHLLVVSGLHVSAVSAGIYYILRRLRRSRRTAAVTALIAMLGFGCLVGWSASVVRACVMTGMMWVGLCFRRSADSLNSLGGGLLLLWILDPFCVYDLGLWCSFGATVGLILIYPALWKYISERRVLSRGNSVWTACIRGAVQMVCITLSATLPLLPLMVGSFGEISLISPLTNLLTVFPATIVLGLALVLLPLQWLGASGLASMLSLPVTALSRYLMWVTARLAALPGAVWSVRMDSLRVWAVGGLVLLWLGWRWRRGKGLRTAAAVNIIVLCAAVLLNLAWMRGVTELTACTRYGHTAVVAERDGRTMAVVSGAGDSWTAALQTLREQGRNKVDFVVVTDALPVPGQAWQLFASQIEVGRYWLTTFDTDTAALLLSRGERVEVLSWVESGEITFWDGDRLILSRDSGRIQIQFGDASVFLGAREQLPPSPQWVELAMDGTDRENGRMQWRTRNRKTWTR